MSLDAFYRATQKLLASDTDLSEVAKTIVLFRAAVEHGATHMGFSRVTHLMARILAETLGITAGNESAGYETILDEFDSDDETQH